MGVASVIVLEAEVDGVPSLPLLVLVTVVLIRDQYVGALATIDLPLETVLMLVGAALSVVVPAEIVCPTELAEVTDAWGKEAMWVLEAPCSGGVGSGVFEMPCVKVGDVVEADGWISVIKYMAKTD